MQTDLEILSSHPTIEGAGVHLRRVFGFAEVPHFDPFLLLDDFRSSNPADYLPGFPWHPHRGIETITLMLEGRVEHGDSLGNTGVIGPGDVQWMTAGSGIIHQEMPKGEEDGRLAGLQLWLNLPATHKMMPPRYRDVTTDQIPEIDTGRGARVRVIAGAFDGAMGPVQDALARPEVLLVTLDADGQFVRNVPPGQRALTYLLDGAVRANPGGDRTVEAKHLAAWPRGGSIELKADEQGARLLWLSAHPLHEPVAWRGPIVMNTQEELRTAFEEFRAGTFLRHADPGEGDPDAGP